MASARSLAGQPKGEVASTPQMPPPLEEGFQWLERVLVEAEVCSGARVCLLQHALTDLQHLIAYCHATAQPHTLTQSGPHGEEQQDEASVCGGSESGLGEGEDEEDLGGLRGRIQQVLGSAREVTQQDTPPATANGKAGGAAKQAVGSGATQQSAAASVPKKPPVPNRAGVVSKPSSSSSSSSRPLAAARRRPSSPLSAPARTPRPLPPQHMTPASPSLHPPTPAAAPPAPPPDMSTQSSKRRLQSTQRPTTPAQAVLPSAPSPEVLASRLERLHQSTSRLRGVLRELQTQSGSTAGALAGETTSGGTGADEGTEARLAFLRQLAPAWDILAHTTTQEGVSGDGGVGGGCEGVEVEEVYGMLDQLRSMATAPHRLHAQHTQQVGSRPSPVEAMHDRATQVLALARAAVASAASSSLPSPQDSISCDAYLDDFIRLATTPPPPPLAPKPRPVASSLAARQQLNRPTPTQAQAPAAPSPLPLPPPPAPSSDALPELSLSAIQAQVGERLLPVLVQCFREASGRAPASGPSDGHSEWLGLMLAYRALHTLLTQPTARPCITAVAPSTIG